MGDSNSHITGFTDQRLTFRLISPYLAGIEGVKPSSDDRQSTILIVVLYTHINLVPPTGLEPVRLAVLDFKSSVSTYSTTRACLVRRDGVAPPESLDNAFTVRPATTYGISTDIWNVVKEFNLVMQGCGLPPKTSGSQHMFGGEQ